jgi:hypothetical protein
MSNKHPRPDRSPVDLPADDLEENPGIGQSAGMFARGSSDDGGLIEGENTIEGDTENNADSAGAVHPDLGRTNR